MIANCGAIFGSCIAAGVYATNLSDACHYIASHSEAEVVVVDGNKQLKKFAEMKESLPALKAIVVYGEIVDPSLVKQSKVKVYAWEEFMALGRDVPDSALDQRAASVKPGNCSTLIYTSGTTGPPKAVMISHDNLTWTAKTMCESYIHVNHTERLVSFLPLSHIAAQLIDIHVPMTLGAALYFAQPSALKGSLAKTLREVQPTVFFGVPRVWEKIHERMLQVLFTGVWILAIYINHT